MSEQQNTVKASSEGATTQSSAGATAYTLNLIRGNSNKCMPIRIFKTDQTYIWSHKFPPSKTITVGNCYQVANPEFEHYTKRMISGRSNSWVLLHFRGENCSYWYNEKHCAIVIGTFFYLCPVGMIDETILQQNNFVKKKIAPMPFDLSGCFLPKNFKDILTETIYPFTDTELQNS